MQLGYAGDAQSTTGINARNVSRMSLECRSTSFAGLWDLGPRRGVRRRPSAENDADAVCLLIVSERNARRARDGRAIELHLRHPPADTARILDDDVIPGGMMAEGDGEARPRSRDTGIDDEMRAPQP